jgi:hypothetical protein
MSDTQPEALIVRARATVEQAAVEPYCYVYEYDHKFFGLHRQFEPTEWNAMKPTRTVAVYTAPTAALENGDKA